MFGQIRPKFPRSKIRIEINKKVSPQWSVIRLRTTSDSSHLIRHVKSQGTTHSKAAITEGDKRTSSSKDSIVRAKDNVHRVPLQVQGLSYLTYFPQYFYFNYVGIYVFFYLFF
uniref:Uncharacterized protein n=1 Tax=Cacopsylla melanoneura TaxID=428564 RepID=A0A8D8X6G7_9HEMI